jgi:hypothetical protein
LGLFGLPDDDRHPVKPKGRASDPVARDSRKRVKDDFLKSVREAVKEARRLGLEPGGASLNFQLR